MHQQPATHTALHVHTWQQQAHDKERQRSVADRQNGSSLLLLLPPLLILRCRQRNGQGADGRQRTHVSCAS
jgi:hypothetical protein